MSTRTPLERHTDTAAAGNNRAEFPYVTEPARHTAACGDGSVCGEPSNRPPSDQSITPEETTR